MNLRLTGALLLSLAMLFGWPSVSSAQIQIQTAGSTDPGTTEYPDSGILDLGSLDFTQYGRPLQMVLDRAQRYAFVVTDTDPARVLKIIPGTLDQRPRIVSHMELEPGEWDITTMLIDRGNGYLYLAYRESEETNRIVKLRLEAGTEPPTRLGSLAVPANTGNLITGVMDEQEELIYYATDFLPALFVIDAGEGDDLPSLVSGPLMLGTDYAGIRTVVLDSTRSALHLGTNRSPAEVVTVDLTPGVGNGFSIRGEQVLPEGNDGIISSAIDEDGGFAYFGTNTSPGKVIKMDIDTGTDLPEFVGSLELGSRRDVISSLIFDPAAELLFAGTATSPGQVVTIDPQGGTRPPVELDTLVLPRGYDVIVSGVHRPSLGDLLYSVTEAGQSGRIVRVATPSESGRQSSAVELEASLKVPFAAGTLATPIAHSETGHVYYAGRTLDGNAIVKFRTDESGRAAEYVASAVFDELGFSADVKTAAIDEANNVGYFIIDPPAPIVSRGAVGESLDLVGARIVIVDLGEGDDPPSLIEVQEFPTDEVFAAAVHPTGGYLLLTHNLGSSRLATKFRLSNGNDAFEETEEHSFGAGLEAVTAIAINPFNGNVIFAATRADNPEASETELFLVNPGDDADDPFTSLGKHIWQGAGLHGFMTSVVLDSEEVALFGADQPGGAIIPVDLNSHPNPLPGDFGQFGIAGNIVGATGDRSNGMAWWITGQGHLHPLRWSGDAPGLPETFGDFEVHPEGAYAFAGGKGSVTGVVSHPHDDDEDSSTIRTLSLSAKGFLHASRIEMTEPGVVSTVVLSVHDPGPLARVAIYEDGATYTRLWQSGPDNDYFAGRYTFGMGDGQPAESLYLTPGTYWLAWQTETTRPLVGHVGQEAGQGFAIPLEFGSAPSFISPVQRIVTDNFWGHFIQYTAAETDPPSVQIFLSNSVTRVESPFTGTYTVTPVDPLTNPIEKVELYVQRGQGDVNWELVGEVSDGTWLFDPSVEETNGLGYGQYFFGIVATDVFGHANTLPDSVDDFANAVGQNRMRAGLYNAQENTQFTHDPVGPGTYFHPNYRFPMTNSMTFRVDAPAASSPISVSRAVGGMNPPALGQYVLLGESIAIASQEELFADLRWPVDWEGSGFADNEPPANFMSDYVALHVADGNTVTEWTVSLEFFEFDPPRVLVEPLNDVVGTWYIGREADDVEPSVWMILGD